MSDTRKIARALAADEMTRPDLWDGARTEVADPYRSNPPSPAEVLAHSGVTPEGWRRGWQAHNPEDRFGVVTLLLRAVKGLVQWTHPHRSDRSDEWHPFRADPGDRFRPVLISPDGEVIACEWPLDAEGYQSHQPTDAQREKWPGYWESIGTDRGCVVGSASWIVKMWQPGDRCKPLEQQNVYYDSTTWGEL